MTISQSRRCRGIVNHCPTSKGLKTSLLSIWVKRTHRTPEELILEATTYKQCSKCKVSRLLGEFVKSRVRDDGRHPICKQCQHEWYVTNRLRVQNKCKEYIERNVETINANKRAYARRRFFYKTGGNLKLRAEGAPCATYQELSRLWKQQRGVCRMTGRRLNRDNAHIDHIIPVKRGGTHTIENLRWVHRDFDYMKRDRLDSELDCLIDEYVQQRTIRAAR